MAFGGSDNEVKIKVTTDASQARQEIGLLTKVQNAFTDGVKQGAAEAKKEEEQLKKLGKAASDASGGFNKLQRDIISLDSAFSLIGRGVATFRQIGAAIQEAGRIEGVTNSFKTLQASVGQLSDKTLTDLRKATQGLISDTTLMQKANQAVLLGLPIQKFDELSAAAIKLGRAMGLDAAQAVESLTLGVGRQSKLILDNLGVILNVEEAYQKYADANRIVGRELTDNEKKLAFQAEAFKKITESANNAAEVGNTVATAYSKISTVVENSKAGFLDAINNNTELAGQLDQLAKSASNASGFFTELGEVFGDVAAAYVNLGNSLGDDLSLGFNKIKQQIGDVQEAIAPPKSAKDEFFESFFGTPEEVRQRTAATFAAASKSAKEEAARIAEEQAKLAQKTAELSDQVKDKLKFDEVSGFSQEYVKQLGGEYERTFTKVLNGAISMEDALERINQLTNDNTFTSDQTAGLAKLIENSYDRAKESIQEAEKATRKLTQEVEKTAKALKKSDLDLAAMFGLDSASLLSTGETVQDAIIKALKNINPNDIVSQLQGVREAFLEGITGTPEEIAAETQERVRIFTNEIKKAEQALDDKTKTNADLAKLAGKNKDEGFFGFDLDSVEEDTERAMADALGQGIQLAIDSAFSGEFDFSSVQTFAANAAGSISESIAPGSGPIASALTSAVVGLFESSEDAGTTARKGIDRFFADLFDEDRLSIVVGDQLKRVNDLVFSGDTPFGGNSDFASGTFDDYLTTLPATAQAAFNAVGGGLEELLGVAGDISGQIGAVLANNIGGSMENLQLLVQATGYSFQQLGDAIFEAFFNGELSLAQLNERLAALSDLYLPGIPGQFGALEDAATNFAIALQDDSGSRLLLDSLRDAGAEAQELGKTLPDVATALASALGVGAENVTLFLQAMKNAGINSIEELVNAGNAKLASLALGVQQAARGETPTNTVIEDPTADYTPPTNFSAGSFKSTGNKGGGGDRISQAEKDAKKKEEERKRRIKALNDETYRLLKTTEQYEKILEQLNDETLTNKQAGQQVEQLYGKLKEAIQKQTETEAAYRKELEKGTKANEKKLATLAAAADAANESLNKLTEDGGKALNEIDTSKLKVAVSNLNAMGITLDALGVSAEKMTDTVIKGFLAGIKSIRDAYREVQQIEDLFANGIPNAIGVVDVAFSNLLRGGREGGRFSVDAFRDIFAETSEKVGLGSSERRQAEFKKLSEDLAASKAELQSVLAQGPRAGQSRADYDREVNSLRESVTRQQGVVDEFFTSPVKASFEDLRAELLKTYDPGTVDKFFRALSESGITTFEEFENASDDAVFRILGKLDQLGFPFEETSEDVKAMNKEIEDTINPLDTLISTAKGLQTPLEVANDNISAFLTTSEKLPSIYIGLPPQVDAVATAISGMVGQLANLQKDYQIGVTFTVDAVYNGNSKEISDMIRDNLLPTTDTTSGPGLTPPTQAQKRRYKDLKKQGKTKQAARFLRRLEGMGVDVSGFAA